MRHLCRIPQAIILNSVFRVLACATLFFATLSYSQNEPSTAEPLRLVQTISLPNAVKGNFDHFAIDLKRNRLFATPEDFKAVLVFNADSGKLIHQIAGVVRAHAILYRPDLDRLYVTDGGDGSVKVFDGETYRQTARIPLLKDADSIGYDISRKILYVDNGGGDAGQSYSMLSAIDTTAINKLADLRIDGDTLEAMALDNYRPHIYLNDKATNQVIVVDRFKNSILEKWPLTLAKQNVAMALDEQRQRLFIGCRSGQIVVLDSNTGKELQALPIHKGVDDLTYDPVSRRLYASTDGFMDIFQQSDLNHYPSLGSVPTGASGRTSRLVPELNRLYVAVPQAPPASARIIVFEPINLPASSTPPADVKEPVNAPAAENLVLEELSLHPLLRRMGLHVIPPGRETMVLIANGNATRIGIHTSEGDFSAVKEGKIYGPRIADGNFYNMKMPMFDAQRRPIGILVMEIACSDAVSEEDAARKADGIREELARKIPSLNALFAPASSN
jgi:DNA-binding beta-propeller fold protein YncE